MDLVLGQFLGGRLMGYAEALQGGGNLISYMAAQGQSLITIGTAFVGVSAALDTVSKFIPGLSAITGGIKGILSSLGSVGMMVGSMLIVEGVIMAYVIPFLPSTVMLFAAVGWIILVIELFVALPLFAAALAFAEGDGLTPQQARHGLAVFGGILLRPTLLVFGFAFAFLALSFASKLLGLAFGVYLAMQSEAGTGPVAFVAMLGILVVTATSLVYFIAKMITHLADYAPQWIGGSSGASLGVDQASAGATQQMSGTAKAAVGAGIAGAGRAASGATKGIAKGQADGAAAKEAKAEADGRAQDAGYKDSDHQQRHKAAVRAQNLKDNHNEGKGGNEKDLADVPKGGTAGGGGDNQPKAAANTPPTEGGNETNAASRFNAGGAGSKSEGGNEPPNDPPPPVDNGKDKPPNGKD